jgi:hypothetical protein
MQKCAGGCNWVQKGADVGCKRVQKDETFAKECNQSQKGCKKEEEGWDAKGCK